MLDRILPYYERELTALRQLGREFANEYPKVAGRLHLDGETVADPHVERLVEAFAFLTARIRLKLDDEFPEITEALLNLLYPHYLRPIPSLTVVQFQAGPADAALTGRYTIDRHAALVSRPVRGMPCRFRTCYPVDLWPIRLTRAALEPVERSPFRRRGNDAVAMLRLRFECFEGLTFAQLGIDKLRLFLDGEGWISHGLHEVLLGHAQGVLLADGEGGAARRIELRSDAIRPVGFAAEDGLLDYGPRSFPGYRLLTEYFNFPEKFLFVDLEGLDAAAAAGFGPQLEVSIPIGTLERTERLEALQQTVSREHVKLGCTPAVNLFTRMAEPIRIDHRRTEYQVLPDVRRPWAMEVYGVESVQRVRRSGRDEEIIDVPAFFGLTHGHGGEPAAVHWYEHRRPSTRPDDPGTELFLALVDTSLNPQAPAGETLSVEVTCTNRDLPGRLPFGGGSGDFELESGGAVARVAVLRKPTPTVRPELRGGTQWRLISHLALNHLSIVGSGRDALLELLSLYNIDDRQATRQQIAGITAVASRPVTTRIGRPPRTAFCRGLEVEISFDEDEYVGGSAYLLALVLERFVALYASVNSFTRLIARSRQREGALAQWPPRTGEQPLL